MLENNGDLHSPTSGQPGNALSLTDRVRSLRLPDRPARGSGVSLIIPWLLCLVLAGSTGYFAWVADGAWLPQDIKPGDGNARGGATKDDRKLPAGNNRDPAAKPGGIATKSKGNIVPISLIQVSPKVSGTVMKVGAKFRENEFINKGYVLAELEDVEYKADYDRIKAQVQQAEFRSNELWKYRKEEVKQIAAELADTKAQRDQLFRDWKRSLDLRGTNALSPKEFEQAEYAYKSMEHRLEKLQLVLNLLDNKGPRDERIGAAKAEIDQWKAELTKAKWKLDNCAVKAPISGVLLRKNAEEGNIVNPSAFSNGLSASLCEMADLREMEVDLAIPERDLAKIFEGQECNVQAEAFLDRNYKGVVSRIMPMANRGSGSVPVRVKIDIPHTERQGEYLRPEMGAVVQFFHKK